MRNVIAIILTILSFGITCYTFYSPTPVKASETVDNVEQDEQVSSESGSDTEPNETEPNNTIDEEGARWIKLLFALIFIYGLVWLIGGRQ